MKHADKTLIQHDYQLVTTVVMKNCDPLVSGPAFAIDKTPVSVNIMKILRRWI